MARTPSITAEQVAEAAETLLQRGETPSVRRVREMLGTGSNATVQALLHTWTAQQPAADTPQVAMSEGLAQAVKAELERVNAAAKAEAAEALERSATARKTAEQEAARLQDELEAAQAQAAGYLTEKQHAEGRCSELSLQVEDLKRNAAGREDAERKLAAALAKLELLEPRAKLADDLQARVAVLEAQAAKGGKISP